MPIFLTFGAVKILKIHNNHKVDMKKVILVVAIAGLAISCQKIQAGGNKGVLKMEEGATRYSDDVMTDKPMTVKETEVKPTIGMVTSDSTKTVDPLKMDSAKVTAPTSATATPVKK
ncbi:hypothetical protein [Kaistella jeonii]|uniref:Uncharacterized protein n=1 Tax=Kaistella jeonii TaxID=266749 RepID=A0A0C1FFQ5_9FLAO|nr:hypothetical protein [Kaistella jeonii]KIA90618.1 hypothetical protein OA86_01680 [Kaistella jeonii]SFB70035.1 hypothetical protein SAMN05421876_101187 [Kaistella jeonii]VEI94786.1 Uncharacterised protein [Kaistella jeonii]